MAHKPRVIDQRQRELRQRGYESSARMSAQFPQVKELTLELRFTGADHKLLLSSYKQIYTGEMQAFFDLQCPSKDCWGGGFDVSGGVARATQSPTRADRGNLRCRGVRTDAASGGDACPVELAFEVTVSAKADRR